MATSPPPAPGPAPLCDRYEDLGLVGQGGMGEVRRVFDRELRRPLAMKIMRPGLPEVADAPERFALEARITAGLQHPGIVPVHDAGHLPDGRLYYTMRLVEGRTLRQVITLLHEPPPADAPALTLWEVVEHFRRVCEAVAFAHSRGVVHRDLKPSNVMVGAFGEVLVLDWGLAQPVLPPDEAQEGPRPRPVVGTPAYLAPELARGDVGAEGPAADVYALGAILYEILSGRPPYVGATPWLVLAQVLAGAPPEPIPPAEAGGQTTWLVPPEAVDAGAPPAVGAPPAPPGLGEAFGAPLTGALVALCQEAMARDPAARLTGASAMADALGVWLAGSQRRRNAAALVRTAEGRRAEATRLRAEADHLQAEALDRLTTLEAWRPAAEKRAAWALEEQALALAARADAEEADWLQGLHAALLLDPELPEAHRLLADHHQAEHAAAEERRDRRAAARAERMLRAHDREGRHRAWLSGDGVEGLVTDPPGAEVTAWRLEVHERRLARGAPRSLGRTPLVDHPLPVGSWLLAVETPGRQGMVYPVVVGRARPWSGAPPGEGAPRPVPLLRGLGAGEVYVPAGWFQRGGDPQVSDPEPRTWVWVEGFVMARHPVTNAEYLCFLNDVLDREGEARAVALAPSERGAHAAGTGAPPIYPRGPDGHFRLGRDADGDEWRPAMPVVHVDLASAQAYAAWWSERTGLPWTLPTEDQWEKAARGVDARIYPWGDLFDASFARVAGSTPGGAALADVDTHPLDESIYGVRGMAGNVQDWSLSLWRPRSLAGLDRGPGAAPRPGDPEAPRALRGGAWRGSPAFARCAERSWARPAARTSGLGFRLARPLVPGDHGGGLPEPPAGGAR